MKRLFLLLCVPAALWCQSGFKTVNSTVSDLVGEISGERVARSMRKLESFGTRDLHSKGNAAAREWLVGELKTYSPRLEVRLETFHVKKQGRIQRDLDRARSQPIPIAGAVGHAGQTCEQPPPTP